MPDIEDLDESHERDDTDQVFTFVEVHPRAFAFGSPDQERRI